MPNLEQNVMTQVATRVAGDQKYLTLLQTSTSLVLTAKAITVDNVGQESVAADVLKMLRDNSSALEDMRTGQVAFPNRFVKVVNTMFKVTKEENHKAVARVKELVVKYRRKKENEQKAAELDAMDSNVGVFCDTCGYVDMTEEMWRCGKFAEEKQQNSIVHGAFTCPKHDPNASTMVFDLADEGDVVTLAVSSPPPPPPESNVTKGEQGSLHTRKEWDFEVTDFGKFVRAVGSNAKPELVPVDLLKINRAELLKILRKEDRVKRIAGLKIHEVHTVVGR